MWSDGRRRAVRAASAENPPRNAKPKLPFRHANNGEFSATNPRSASRKVAWHAPVSTPARRASIRLLKAAPCAAAASVKADETAPQLRESRNPPECGTALRAVPAAAATAKAVARARFVAIQARRQDQRAAAHFVGRSNSRPAANYGP